MFIRLSTKDKMILARNMAMMAHADMQVIDILKTILKQTPSKTVQKMYKEIIKDVENGTALYDAFGKFPKVFGEFFINIVKVGEVSGSLAENLDFLAEAFKKKASLESKVLGALIYPIILLLATFGMMAGMIFFIFPKILPIFKSLKADLPSPTRIFIGISSFIIDNSLITVAGIIIFIILIVLILRIKKARYGWQVFLLHVPIVSKMIVDFNVVNFARTMSLLLKGGSKIVETINITADTISNLVYKKRLHLIAKEVRSGTSISEHLEKYRSLFPVTFAHMIGVGEKTGKLSETGLYLADFYESELDRSTKSVTNLMEPLLLLFMGLIVAFVAISIILPIYNIGQNI